MTNEQRQYVIDKIIENRLDKMTDGQKTQFIWNVIEAQLEETPDEQLEVEYEKI